MKLFISILLLGLAMHLGGLSSNPQGSPSDREKDGLRSAVKICVEEITYPGAIAADGTKSPEWTSRYQTEYDPRGHILARRRRNSDGSVWAMNYTYNSAGNLLTIASGTEGKPSIVTGYTYDDRGRPLSITDSNAPDNPVTFRYDDRGRKTKVQVSRAEDYRANVGVAGSPFSVADRRPNMPGGGTAFTTYDEYDRPIEVEIRDGQGEKVSRAVRIYDEQGHVVEEKQILDDPLNLLPAETRAKVLSQPGVSAGDLREQITKLMSGHEGVSSAGYSYDSQGRITQIDRRIFTREDKIETSYNERGDVASEITRSTQSDSQNNTYSKGRYSYQYDEHGNWTEKIVAYSFTPGGLPERSDKSRRTLTYF
jgi:YD repeat-containing protein